MSLEEIEKLKSELKKELLNELTTKQIVKDNAWKVIKSEFEKMYYSKGYSTYEVHQILTGISPIVRYSLGYKSVSVIPASEAENIKQIMYKIYNLIPSIA